MLNLTKSQHYFFFYFWPYFLIYGLRNDYSFNWLTDWWLLANSDTQTIKTFIIIPTIVLLLFVCCLNKTFWHFHFFPLLLTILAKSLIFCCVYVLNEYVWSFAHLTVKRQIRYESHSGLVQFWSFFILFKYNVVAKLLRLVNFSVQRRTQ